MVAEEEFCLGTLLKDYQHAAVDHHVDIRAENVYHLYGTVAAGVLGNVDEEAVLSQHRVKSRDGIFFHLCGFGIVLRYDVVMFDSRMG